MLILFYVLDMDKQTYYNRAWEDPTEYPEFALWIEMGKDSKHFRCKVCKTGSLKLSNMGTEVLKSHTIGFKKKGEEKRKSRHEQNMDILSKQECATSQSKLNFAPVKTSSSTTSSTTSSSSTTSAHTLQLAADVVEVSSIDKPSVQTTLPTRGKDIKRAEILLAMKSVVSHIPQRSLDDFPSIARKMFPDSEIAKKLETGWTKLKYNINNGLAPYYTDKLYESLAPEGDNTVPPKFVACFDESYNSVTHNKQFDVHVIYFDESTHRVTRKYLTSNFIGHGDANSLRNHLEHVLEKLEMKNLIQISMDGPNVNWKMLEIAIEERKRIPHVLSYCKLGHVASTF